MEEREEPPIVPLEPNPFWRDNAQKLVSESISTTEDAAKQFIIINSFLEGIYFHAITFSDVKPMLTGATALIYMAPIALWLLSIFFSILTLSPPLRNCNININSSSDCKEKFEEIVAKKNKSFSRAEIVLILSFIALFVAVAHYLFAVPVTKI